MLSDNFDDILHITDLISVVAAPKEGLNEHDDNELSETLKISEIFLRFYLLYRN